MESSFLIHPSPTSLPRPADKAGGHIRLRKGAALAKRRKALLCVDDNQSCLNTGKIILEDFGYTVLTAKSSREGT